MIQNMTFGIMGGLALFLFGMGMMSDGLKKVAGQKLRSLLESLTKNRIIAILIGALVTALIQSSSATTVMTVGFVNAALLTLKQALCVVLGANVGTTITAWLVSILGIGKFKIAFYSLPAIGVGFLMQITGKTPKFKSSGTILLGLGLLFLGLSFMKEAFDPIKESPGAQEALISLASNPLLALLAGTVLTMLLQSSSATTAMVQLLAASYAFGERGDEVLKVAIPFILGGNIGTTITAQLAALRASRNSKRVAIGHTIFNCLGVLYFLPLVWLGFFSKLVIWITPLELTPDNWGFWIMVHLAVAHTIFNVFNTIVFLPLISWLEALAMKILPITEMELAAKPVVLERHLFNTPVIALEQAKREIIRMAERARESVQQAVEGIIGEDVRKLKQAQVSEDIIDEFQLAITSYLADLSQEQLSEEVSIKLPVLLHTVNDLERVGDHSVNIVEIAERKIGQKITFSDHALGEADQLKKEIDQMFGHIIEALVKDDIEAARSVLINESNLNKMQMDFRQSHVQRMTEGICSPSAGLVFIDLVDNVEKIGDHLTNVAQAVIGGLQWDGVELEEPPSL
ncbi:MAG: Na/Pi cotransporter family protein [Planctomycetota bacterium]|jgi:phosphate:Na+ symporter